MYNNQARTSLWVRKLNMHPVRSRIVRSNCRSDQAFYRCKAVRVFHAEYYACLLKVVGEILGFTLLYDLTPSWR